jgi:transketolase
MAARVFSVPCLALLFAAPADQRAVIVARLPSTSRKPACASAGTRPSGAFVGTHSFGASARHNALYRHFHIAAEAVAEVAMTRPGQGLVPETDPVT